MQDPINWRRRVKEACKELLLLSHRRLLDERVAAKFTLASSPSNIREHSRNDSTKRHNHTNKCPITDTASSRDPTQCDNRTRLEMSHYRTTDRTCLIDDVKLRDIDRASTNARLSDY